MLLQYIWMYALDPSVKKQSLAWQKLRSKMRQEKVICSVALNLTWLQPKTSSCCIALSLSDLTRSDKVAAKAFGSTHKLPCCHLAIHPRLWDRVRDAMQVHYDIKEFLAGGHIILRPCGEDTPQPAAAMRRARDALLDFFAVMKAEGLKDIVR